MMTTGGRRTLKLAGSHDSATVDDSSGLILNTHAVLPQHSSMPDIQLLNEVSFQFVILANSMVLMCFQYVNLYHNLWWLPNTHCRDAVDFNAIDYDLLVLIVLILSYKLLQATVCKVFDKKPSKFSQVSKYAVLGIYSTPVIGTFFVITRSYPAKKWGLLLIPLFIYIVLFGQSITRQFMRYVPWFTSSQQHKPRFYTERFHNLNHACSMNPEHVRNEVTLLKSDFNYRLKTVYFEAIVAVYYSTVIPTAFCKHLYRLDLLWIGYFMVISALIRALFSFVQRIPAEYLHTLHKSAVHLGHWRKHEERLVNIPHSVWSELTVWPKGVNVKHTKGLFKADGVNNSAEPGNAMHAKFYQMFKRPEYIYLIATTVAFTAVAVEYYLLTAYRQWHQQLAIAGLMLSTYFPLYVAFRDYLILNRVIHDFKSK